MSAAFSESRGRAVGEMELAGPLGFSLDCDQVLFGGIVAASRVMVFCSCRAAGECNFAGISTIRMTVSLRSDNPGIHRLVKSGEWLVRARSGCGVARADGKCGRLHWPISADALSRGLKLGRPRLEGAGLAFGTGGKRTGFWVVSRWQSMQVSSHRGIS